MLLCDYSRIKHLHNATTSDFIKLTPFLLVFLKILKTAYIDIYNFLNYLPL